MAKGGYLYRNELPDMPADPLLPKFNIPQLSSKIMKDSKLYNELKTNLTPDPFLGIPVEFSNLAIYNEQTSIEDFSNEDLKYMEIASQNSIPQIQRESEAAIHSKPRREIKKAQEAKSKPTSYIKSEPITGPDDPQIQKQLAAAFGGEDKIPPGKVQLFKKAPELEKFSFVGSKSYTTDGKNILLEGWKRIDANHVERYIKEIQPLTDETEHDPINGFKETIETDVNWAYLVYPKEDDEDQYIKIGPSTRERRLQMMVPRDRKINELTATPVLLSIRPKSEQ